MSRVAESGRALVIASTPTCSRNVIVHAWYFNEMSICCGAGIDQNASGAVCYGKNTTCSACEVAASAAWWLAHLHLQAATVRELDVDLWITLCTIRSR